MKQASLSTKAQNALFAITLISLAVVGAISVYLWLNFSETSQLKAQLQSQLELQEGLIRESSKRSELLSHIDPDVSYVLNRYTPNPSYRAAEGSTYHVNSLGLRGKEITPKPAGTKRIALVGDSVVFGWRLTEQDRLESVLSRRIEQNFKRIDEFGQHASIPIVLVLPDTRYSVSNLERFSNRVLAVLTSYPRILKWTVTPGTAVC